MCVFGTKPSHFTYSHQWKIDIDYWQKLSSTDQAYLAQFLKEFYEGSNYPKPILPNKKESYARNNASYRDVMRRFVRTAIDQQEPQVVDHEKDLTNNIVFNERKTAA